MCVRVCVVYECMSLRVIMYLNVQLKELWYHVYDMYNNLRIRQELYKNSACKCSIREPNIPRYCDAEQTGQILRQ